MSRLRQRIICRKKQALRRICRDVESRQRVDFPREKSVLREDDLLEFRNSVEYLIKGRDSVVFFDSLQKLGIFFSCEIVQFTKMGLRKHVI